MSYLAEVCFRFEDLRPSGWIGNVFRFLTEQEAWDHALQWGKRIRPDLADEGFGIRVRESQLPASHEFVDGDLRPICLMPMYPPAPSYTSLIDRLWD